jgi:hypothetical protein
MSDFSRPTWAAPAYAAGMQTITVSVERGMELKWQILRPARVAKRVVRWFGDARDALASVESRTEQHRQIVATAAESDWHDWS